MGIDARILINYQGPNPTDECHPYTRSLAMFRLALITAALAALSGCGNTRVAGGFGSVGIGGTLWGSPSITATLGDYQNGKPGILVSSPDPDKAAELTRELMDRFYPAKDTTSSSTE